MPTQSRCSWNTNEARIYPILSPNREEVFRKRNCKSDLEVQDFPDPILTDPILPTALGHTAVGYSGSMKA